MVKIRQKNRGRRHPFSDEEQIIIFCGNPFLERRLVLIVSLIKLIN
jgi:hypothetical protein